jgi:ribonuclease HI
MRYMVHIHFLASNNVAKYEALINGLHIAVELGIRWLDVRDNSQLVSDQAMKELSYRSAKIAIYCQGVHQLEDMLLAFLSVTAKSRYGVYPQQRCQKCQGVGIP